MADVLCFEDLDQFGTDIDDPIAELEQDVFHILIETPGSNIDDPDRGLGLEDALSGEYDPKHPALIAAGLEKDPRIDAARCVITPREGGEYEIDISIDVNEQELQISLQFDGTVLRKAPAT